MTRYLAAYGAAFVVMFVLDMVWLRGIASSWYQQGIGHLMAPDVNVVAGAIFYLIFPVGLVIFAVNPSAGWPQALVMGALFGFFAYATYDLTNLATLKNWPLGLSVMDTAWGAAVSGVSAVAGRLAANAVG